MCTSTEHEDSGGLGKQLALIGATSCRIEDK